MSLEIIPLFMSVSQIKGVGTKTVEAFKRLHIRSIFDLLTYKPISLIDRRNELNVKNAYIDQVVTFVAEVVEIHKSKTKAPSKVICLYKESSVELLYFNPKSLNPALFEVGKEIAITGKISNVYYDCIQISHPDTVLAKEQFDTLKIIQPVYQSTYGTTSRYIHSAILNAIRYLPQLTEWLDVGLVKKYNLPSFKDAIMALHKPISLDALDPFSPNILRLAIDEMLAESIALRRVKNNRKKRSVVRAPFQNRLRQKLLESLPFNLTKGQVVAINDIEQDQSSSSRMTRLIQADVGSGKTIVAICAMLNAVESGGKAILIAPTEILALQHFDSVSRLLKDMGINISLLISNVKQSMKNEVLARLELEEPMIVIGTHALLQDDVKINNIGIIVIDEQQRFGVAQRNVLFKQNPRADLLMLSATPIPRTLSMSINGDLDLSIIRDKPECRRPIITTLLSIEKIAELIYGIRRCIERNEKVYWVCPLIEESLKVNRGYLELRYKHLFEIFKDEVCIVHGKMTMQERKETMQSFISGRCKILLATSVIEVGVDVKDATIIVIENAETFGLAQLHQLRGRVGRGDLQSYCVLLYGHRLSQVSKERLGIMRSYDDGFIIAEKDMQLRGIGDYLGTKQSGLSTKKFFDYILHDKILQDIIHLLPDADNAKYDGLLKLWCRAV